MGVIVSKLATRIHELLKSKGYTLIMYDEYGDRVYEPSTAFMFFSKGNRMMVNILDSGEESTVRVNISKDEDITEIETLIIGLRQAATHYGYLFTVQKYTKVLEPKDFALMAVTETTGEGVMSYGKYARALVENDTIQPEIGRWAQIFQNLDAITSDGLDGMRGYQDDERPDVNRARDLTQQDEYFKQAERWVGNKIGSGSPNHLKGPDERSSDRVGMLMDFISDILRGLAGEDTILANIIARVGDQLERVVAGEKPDRWFTSTIRNKLEGLIAVTGRKMGMSMPRVMESLSEDWEDRMDRQVQDWENFVTNVWDAADCAGEIFETTTGYKSFTDVPDEEKNEVLETLNDLDLSSAISDYVRNYDESLYDVGDDLLPDVISAFNTLGVEQVDGEWAELDRSPTDELGKLDEWFDQFDPDLRGVPDSTPAPVAKERAIAPYQIKEDRLGNANIIRQDGAAIYVRGRDASNFLNHVAMNALDLSGREADLYEAIETTFGDWFTNMDTRKLNEARAGTHSWEQDAQGGVVIRNLKTKKSTYLSGKDAVQFQSELKSRRLDDPAKELELMDMLSQYDVVMESHMTLSGPNDIAEYFTSQCAHQSVEQHGPKIVIIVDPCSMSMDTFRELCTRIGCVDSGGATFTRQGLGGDSTVWGDATEQFVESINIITNGLHEDIDDDTVIPGHMEKDLLKDIGATRRDKAVKARLSEDDDTPNAHGFVFDTTGYDGTVFGDFHVRKDGQAGPGWFIFGRNSEKYGTKPDGTGAYVRLCGYARRGKARNYNGLVRIGWKTRAEAEAALATVSEVTEANIEAAAPGMEIGRRGPKHTVGSNRTDDRTPTFEDSDDLTTSISKARAEEIWASGSQYSEYSKNCTPDERAEITRLWGLDPNGSSSFASTLNKIRKGEIATRTDEARDYFTLVGKDDGPWEIMFGDYDRAVVKQEQVDSKDSHVSYKKTKIIKSGAKQADINKAVAELNALTEADEYEDDEAAEAIINRINEIIDASVEYETSHVDAGDAYAHMPAEGDTVEMVRRIKESAEEFEIDLTGVDDDVLLDFALDNFKMYAGSIYLPRDLIVFESYPVGEVEIQLDYIDGFTPEFARAHENEFSGAISINDSNAHAYVSTDTVWYAAITPSDLENAVGGGMTEDTNYDDMDTHDGQVGEYWVPGENPVKIENGDKVVFKFTSRKNGTAAAIGYTMNNSEYDFLFAFKSEESRDRYVDNYLTPPTVNIEKSRTDY